MDITPKVILKDALKYLRPRVGWIKNSYRRWNGKRDCYCLAGAVRKSVNDHAVFITGEQQRQLFEQTYKLLAESIAAKSRYGSQPETQVIHFNDRPWRKHSEVLALLRRAIARA